MNKLFEKNKNFSARLTDDDVEFLNEIVPAIINTEEIKTQRQILLELVNEAAKRTKIKKIEEEKFLNQINYLKKEIAVLQQENNNLANKQPIEIEKTIEVEKKLEENQIIFNFTPLELELLKVVIDSESKRTRQVITIEILLKNMFISYLLQGTHDHFPIPFTHNELIELFNKYSND